MSGVAGDLWGGFNQNEQSFIGFGVSPLCMVLLTFLQMLGMSYFESRNTNTCILDSI